MNIQFTPDRYFMGTRSNPEQFRKTLVKHPGDIADRIGFYLQEAKNGEAQLHMNADALVIEYNDAESEEKRFEIISLLEKNNS